MGERFYTSLVDLLEKKAEKNPDFPLYTFIQRKIKENKNLTYRGLAENAKKIASVLHETTLPGDRVLIIYPSGLDFISAFFGCLYAGVIAVPSYPPTTTANHGIYCEKIDGTILNKYLNYLIQCGYLTQLTEEASYEVDA